MEPGVATATLGDMDISAHQLDNAHPVDTGWVDDAIASAATAGQPLGTLVGRPLTPGDGIMFAFRPAGAAGPDGFHLVDSRQLTTAGPAKYMQVVTFEGPRTDEWVRAEERAATGRLWPATSDVAGIVRVLRMRRPDNGTLTVVLAESVDAIDAAQQAILSTRLRPDEDPALLTRPDSIGLYRIVHADLPADVPTAS
jgi:hypothetical protein